MKNLILHFLLFITLLFLALASFYFFGKKVWYPYYEKYSKHSTIIEKVYIDKNITIPCPECPTCPTPLKLTSEQKLKRHLADANFVMYPKKLILIGLKHEQILEVWAEEKGETIYITSYPFTAFSGRLGPKFREGDRQIPEGIYGIGYLNPNSRYHLSMNINYPNAFDKRMAKKEKRTNLGSAIMIHGKAVTVGCIPIGDEKIEELYYLVEKVGIKNTKVILAPIDFRNREVEIKSSKYPWLKELYVDIAKEMKKFQ
jgi:murein L,D-transpeptidase YafK